MATIAGHKINNWYLVGGAAGLVLVIILYRRSENGSSPAAGTAGASGTDPVTGLPYSEDSSIDPLTGMSYLAEAQEYGSVSAAEAAVGGQGSGVADGGGYYGGGYSPGYGTGYSTTTPTNAVTYPDNASWAQAVQAGLVALGYSSESVGAALGLYLNHLPLNSQYATIIQTAVAEYGPPPVGTFSIIRTGGGGGGGNKVEVPHVTGMQYEAAAKELSAKGLVPRRATPDVGIVTSQNPRAGAEVVTGTAVVLDGKGSPDKKGPPPKDKVTVPEVIGSLYEDAARKITAAGLVPKRGQASVGIVTKESPAAGSKVDKGSTVTLSGHTPVKR